MSNIRTKQIRSLVVRVWNSDRGAYAILYSMTCDDIYNYCRCIIRKDLKALRIVEDVYSYALNNILHLTDPSLFEAWLRRIAFQKCSEELLITGDSSMYSLLNPAVLDVLPFYERQILFLADYRELSAREIAKILNISKKEVNKGLTQARSNLVKLKENGKI